MIVKFSKETSKNFEENGQDYNEVFLKQVGIYLKDILDAKGYLYQNEIYEELGIEWNPRDTNLAFIKDIDNWLDYVYKICSDGSYNITIVLRNCKN